MSLELSPHSRRAFAALAADLARVFGDRLVAVVAYAPKRAAAFTRTLEAADLDALSVLADTWHRSGLDTPLLLTADEFVRSLDAFPIEWVEIRDCDEDGCFCIGPYSCFAGSVDGVLTSQNRQSGPR